MKFIHSDLGWQRGGTIVEVTINTEANIRMMDPHAFAQYKAGRRHTEHSVKSRVSPTRLALPHDGHWHVAVDLAGRAGTLRASIGVRAGLAAAA